MSRYEFESMLNAQVAHYALVATTASRGQASKGFGATATQTFKGCVRIAETSDRIQAGQDQVATTHVLSKGQTPTATPLRRGDKIVVTFPSIAGVAARTYFVLSHYESSIPIYERWRLEAESHGE